MKFRRIALLAIVCSLIALPAAAEEPTQTALEEQFAKEMSGATLVGFYTTKGKEAEAGLKEDRYLLSEVKKQENGKWLFAYQTSEKGIRIPLTLDVKWAGDTPVITLTDMKVPGVGTFSARVLFYRGDYAGTWSASDHGGHLFGRVEPPADAATREPTPKAGGKNDPERPKE